MGANPIRRWSRKTERARWPDDERAKEQAGTFDPGMESVKAEAVAGEGKAVTSERSRYGERCGAPFREEAEAGENSFRGARRQRAQYSGNALLGAVACPRRARLGIGSLGTISFFACGPCVESSSCSAYGPLSLSVLAAPLVTNCHTPRSRAICMVLVQPRPEVMLLSRWRRRLMEKSSNPL